MSKQHFLGKTGEADAIAHLTSKGYTIAARNYRFDRAEIDIIALKDQLLVVVEVKTRSSHQWGNPIEFLKPAQIRRLVKAADHYITVNDLDVEVRFDVITIVKKRGYLRY